MDAQCNHSSLQQGITETLIHLDRIWQVESIWIYIQPSTDRDAATSKPSWDRRCERRSSDGAPRSCWTKCLRGDLRELTVISYVVLGNNAVTQPFHRAALPDARAGLVGALCGEDVSGDTRQGNPGCSFPGRRTPSAERSRCWRSAVMSFRKRPTRTGARNAFSRRLQAKSCLPNSSTFHARRQEEWLAPLSQAERKTFFELARKIAEGPNLLKSEIMKG